MVLAAEKMGMNPAYVNDAKDLLLGRPVTVTMGALIESEAVKANNHLGANAELIGRANEHVEFIKAEYGFAFLLVLPPSDEEPAEHAAAPGVS